MKLIAFIPARGGSKSIPLKNIKPFYGQPLIYWVLSALKKVKAIDQIVVSTDHADIETAVSSFECENLSMFKRSALNAQDNSSTESTLIEYLDAESIDDSTGILLVQATSPFTSAKDFQNGIDLWKSPEVDSVISCCRQKRFIWSELGEPLNYDFKQRPRRQEFDGYLLENGAFYISHAGDIRQSQNRLSGRIAISEMPSYSALELDEPEDWAIGEALMKHLINC